jgi:hypothetical protein
MLTIDLQTCNIRLRLCMRCVSAEEVGESLVSIFVDQPIPICIRCRHAYTHTLPSCIHLPRFSCPAYIC